MRNIYEVVKNCPVLGINKGSVVIVNVVGKTFMSIDIIFDPKAKVQSKKVIKLTSDDQHIADTFISNGYLQDFHRLTNKPVYSPGDHVVVHSGKFHRSNYKGIQPNYQTPIIVSIIESLDNYTLKGAPKSGNNKYNWKLYAKNINNGEVGYIYTDDVISKAKKYWFIKSGGVACDWLNRNPEADIWRIATGNMYKSYEDAIAAMKEMITNKFVTIHVVVSDIVKKADELLS